MGDQAPPNFNPSVSLLHGGESAHITAVQGGGGSENVTLLSGGEGAQIVPVRGGAKNSIIDLLSSLKIDGNDLDEDLGENTNDFNNNNNNNGGITGKVKRWFGFKKRSDEDDENDDEYDDDENRPKKKGFMNRVRNAFGSKSEEDEDEEDDEDDEDGEGTTKKGKKKPRTHAKVTVEGIAFKIPLYTYEDAFERWEEGDFNEDEMKFLKYIELMDEDNKFTILEEVFGDNWKEELANFLKNIGIGSCFKKGAPLLLTSAECNRVKEFTDHVHLHLYKEVLKDMGVTVPEKAQEPEQEAEAEAEAEAEQEAEPEAEPEAEAQEPKPTEPAKGGRRRSNVLPSIGGFRSLHL
jgi:hypothetical protein